MLAIRYVMIAIIFLSACNDYVLRVNVDISLNLINALNYTEAIHCAIRDSPTRGISISYDKNDLHWSSQIVGLISCAHGIGNLIAGLPASFVVEYFGAVEILILTNLLSGLFNSLIPFLIYIHYSLVIILRFLIGAMSAFCYPCLAALIVAWAPYEEKGRFSSALMGNTIGIIIGIIFVSQIGENLGWHWGYHSITIFMIISSIIFGVLATNTPELHPWISSSEIIFIKSTQKNLKQKSNVIPPYGAILSTRCFWIITIAQIGNLWVFAIFTGETYRFLYEILDFNAELSGLSTISSFLSRLFGAILFGILSDFMYRRKFLKLCTLRRVAAIFSHIIPGFCFMTIYFINCCFLRLLILINVAQFFNGAVVVGHLLNNLDIAPNYAGTLFGLMNFFASFSPIFEIILAAHVIYSGRDFINQLQLVFLIGAIVGLLTGMTYITFLSVEVQPWNDKSHSDSIIIDP